MKTVMTVEIYGLGDEGQVPDPTPRELDLIQVAIEDALQEILDDFPHVAFGVAPRVK